MTKLNKYRYKKLYKKKNDIEEKLVHLEHLRTLATTTAGLHRKTTDEKLIIYVGKYEFKRDLILIKLSKLV